MTFRICGEFIAYLRDWFVQPDGGDHILQWSPLGRMIEHIVDRHERNPGRGGELGSPLKPKAIITGVGRRYCQPDVASKATP